MSLRVVLYAEGGRETGGAFDVPPRAGSTLVPDLHFGPAHFLFKRLLAHARGLPEGAVQFEAPLRIGTRVARGTELLDRSTLRRLLTWFDEAVRAPDLAIVLVDADGDSHRKNTLESHVEGLPVAKVIAVAVQEFETWLIADQNAVHAAMNATHSTLPDLESLPRREAKERLTQWCDASGRNDRDVRMTLAQTCALDSLERRCAAFATLIRELR